MQEAEEAEGWHGVSTEMQEAAEAEGGGVHGVATAMQEDKEAERLHGVTTAMQEADAEVVGLHCVFTTSMSAG
jgi:flagellar hook-basal body complex protein FliE